MDQKRKECVPFGSVFAPIGKDGKLRLPQQVMYELDLSEGDCVSLHVHPDKTVTLSKSRLKIHKPAST